MEFVIYGAWIVLGYILGSFPTSIIAGRLIKGIDIREHGSGNAGATNTVRVLGGGWGIAVGIVDLFKGWLAVFIPMQFGAPILVLMLAGVAAVGGHAFPLFAKFRGGKGVATGAGMVLGLFPISLVICVGVFIILLLLTGIVSIGSMTAAVVLPLSVMFVEGGLQAFRSSDPVGIGTWFFSLGLGIFVIFLHRKNIGRLIRGEEKRFEKIWLLKPRHRD